jgi:hypothetical protein
VLLLRLLLAQSEPLPLRVRAQ